MQRPFQPGICWYDSLPSFVALPFVPVRSEKLRLSGQIPPSTMPMITPSPLVCDQAPPGAVKPRKSGVDDVSTLRASSFVTASTPRVSASLAACSAVMSAAKPLKT